MAEGRQEPGRVEGEVEGKPRGPLSTEARSQ